MAMGVPPFIELIISVMFHLHLPIAVKFPARLAAAAAEIDAHTQGQPTVADHQLLCHDLRNCLFFDVFGLM